jgi:hypothetical protein
MRCTANCQAFLQLARSHLGRLAVWSVARDRPCAGSGTGLPHCSMISQQTPGFTTIFDGFTG